LLRVPNHRLIGSRWAIHDAILRRAPDCRDNASVTRASTQIAFQRALDLGISGLRCSP
jgi:hypothetical protein